MAMGNGNVAVQAAQAEPANIYQAMDMAYPYSHSPQMEQQGDAESGFDFYKYFRIINKYRWLIFVVASSSLMFAIAITLMMTPIYRATSSIQIDREAMNVVGVGGVQPEEAPGGLEFYQTQYELLASRSLAERVVTTLGLVSDADYNAKRATPVSLVKEAVFGSAKDEGADNDASQAVQNRRAVERLSRSLTVTPVRGSRIVKVSIDHTDPDVAQRIANGYAQVFIANNLDRRYEATSYARKFLEERLLQLKAKLEESEKQLVKYAEDQGIIRLDNNKNLSASDLETTNIRLAEVHGERVKKEQLWKRAQATDGLGLKEILDSDAIQSNRKLRAELAAQYQQKLAVFKPAFPDMVQLRNQIKELDRQIQGEIQDIKQSIEASYLALRDEENALMAQLEGTKTEVVDQRNRSIQYNIIQREVDTNRSLYEGLLQRYKEIGVAGAVSANNISIVDEASRPLLPRSPNLPLNIAFALFGGLFLGFAMAVLMDFIDDSFKAPEDIEREIGLPVIGVIPKPKANGLVDAELLDPRSSLAEAFRSLRTGLQFSTSEGLPNTLLVTSSKPSEGKTTTSISLAKSLAQIGLNVLLVDADLRNSAVHKRLGRSNEVGLSNYLSGAMQPEDVVQATETKGLVLMASGPLPPNPAELLTGPRFPSLLALASKSFDIVLIDGPPIMGLADAPLLSSATQSTLMVVAASETRRATVKVALKRLRYARANLVGVLLNKFDAKQTGYGYGYGYGEYEYHGYGNAPQLPAHQS
jgi:polysaccharide biosynthesis transport protein